MIVLNLACATQHRFEAWFRSNDDFQQQSAQGLLTCPVCGNAEIVRLPSSPHVRRSDSTTEAKPAVQTQEAIRTLLHHVAEIARQAEDVGSRFPEEARKIHYEEAPARNIRGVASLEESRELLEEGIAVLPIPAPETSH